MDRTKEMSGSPRQESLANQKLNCLKDIMDTVLQLSDEEWKGLTRDIPKMHTRLEFAALCTKIVTSVSASVVKSYLPSLIDIFGMESVLQADATFQNSEAGSGCLSTTSTSIVSPSAQTTAQRSPANVAAVIGDIVENTLNDLKNAMQTAIWKVASVKASRSTKFRTESYPLENDEKMLSVKPTQPTHTEDTEKGGKIYVLNDPLKEIDPDTAAITGKIVMVVLDVMEGSSIGQTDLQQTRGLLTAAAERIKLLASRDNLYESIIQSTSEQIAPVTREELQTRASRSVSKVLLEKCDSTELPTASMSCQLSRTSSEIVGTVLENIQDVLSASRQSSHAEKQQTSDDFLTSDMSADSGVLSVTNCMFHTIHAKVKEFLNVSKKPVKENKKADRISQLDDLTMNCTNNICGEILSLYNSDLSESKCQTADGGETSEVLLTSHHEIHSVMKGLEELVTMSRSSSKNSLTYLTGQRSKDLLMPESVSVGKEFAPDYPSSSQYAGRIFSDRFQEKAIQTIADVLFKTEEKIFASVSTQYSTAPSSVNSEQDMHLSNAILGTWSGSSTELPISFSTAELLTDSISCHRDSISTEIVENIVQVLDIQDLDMISALEEVDISESPSTSSAAHVSTASGIMGVFLKQIRQLSSDDSGSLSVPAPTHERFLSAARKIHRKIHKMVFGFVSEREELVLADSKVSINLHSSKSAQHDFQSLLSKTSPQAPPTETESSSEGMLVSHSPGFVTSVPSDHRTSEEEMFAEPQECEPIISQSTDIQDTINPHEGRSKATRVVSDVLIQNLSEQILCCKSTASAHSLGSAAHKIAETIISGMDRVDADAILSESKSSSGSTITSTPVNIFANMQKNLQALFTGSFRKTGYSRQEPYDTNNMSESRSSPPCLQDAQPAGDEAVSIFPVRESATLHVDVDNRSNEVIGKVIDLFLHADQLPKSSSSELSKATQVVSDVLVRMASSEILTRSENDFVLTAGPTDFTPISEDMLCAAADVSGTVINVLQDFYDSMHSKVADASSNSEAFVAVFDAFSGNSLTLRSSGCNIVETNSTDPLGIFSKVRCHLRDFFMAFKQEKRPSVETHLHDSNLIPGCSDSSSVYKMESSSLTAHVSGLQMMEDDKIGTPPKLMASTRHQLQCEWPENHMNIDLCTDEVIATIVDLSKSELTDQYTLKNFQTLTSDHFQAKSTNLVSNILFKMVESCSLSNHQIATDCEEHPRKELSDLSKRVDSAASEISRSAGSTLTSFLTTVSASANESGLCVKHSTSSASVTPLRSDVNFFAPLQLFIEVRNKLKGIFTPLLKKSDESNWISAVQQRDADFTAMQDRDAQIADERALTQSLSQRLDSAMTQLDNLISEDTIREYARGITDLTAEILRKDKTRSGVAVRSISDSNLEMSGTRNCASSPVFFPSTIVQLFAEESIRYLLLYLLNPRRKLSLVGSQPPSFTFSNQDMQGSRQSEVLTSFDRLTSEVSGQIEDPVASHVGDCGATSSPASVPPTPSNRTGSTEVNLGNPTLSSEENLPSSTSTRFRFFLKKKCPVIKLSWNFLKKHNLACWTSVASVQIKDPVVSDVTPEHVGTQRDCGATSSPPSVPPTPSNSAGSAEVNLDPAHDVVEKKSSRFFSILKKRSSKFGWKKSNKVCPEKLTPSDLQADNPELSSGVEPVSAVSSGEKPRKMVSRMFSAISQAFPKLLKPQ